MMLCPKNKIRVKIKGLVKDENSIQCREQSQEGCDVAASVMSNFMLTF